MFKFKMESIVILLFKNYVEFISSCENIVLILLNESRVLNESII